jgi:hypothetical protein
MATHNLNDLIGIIGKSLKEALDFVDEFSLNTFMSKFEEKPGDGNGPATIVPKTVKIPFPKPDGTYESKEIPVVSLLNHSSLQIEDLRIKMKVVFSSSAEENVLKAEVGPARPDNDEDEVKPEVAEIEVNFKRGLPPEGLARIATEFQKRVT